MWEPFWTSSLKEGAAGAVGIVIMKTESWGVRPITDIASTTLGEQEMVVCQYAIWDEQP
jgi:hypothetical protein